MRRSGRRLLCCALLAACWTGLTGAGCSQRPVPPASRSPRVRLRFTSGSPGAGFRRFSLDLAREYQRAFPAWDVQIHETRGAASNVEAIERGEADIGLSHADVAYLFFVGRIDSSRGPFEHVRGIAVLHPQRVHVVVARGSGIRRMEDLRGRRISLGPGSSATSSAGIVLRAFGVDLGQTHLQQMRYNEAPARLADGSLDAFIVTGGHPLDAVTAATSLGARILSLDDRVIGRLCHEYPFFRRAVIPGGTYPGQPEAVHTVGVDSLLLCRSDLDERVVQDVTEHLFEILPALRPPSDPVDVEQAPATSIPLHEGAARYYRERELVR